MCLIRKALAVTACVWSCIIRVTVYRKHTVLVVIVSLYHYTRAVQKVSDLWSAKIQLFIWMSETLIPFKVDSLVMHTLLPAVLPLLEIFLESFLWNHVQQVCRVPHNVFSWLKSFHFQRNFQFGEQPEITRGHVGRVGSLTIQGNVVFSQKTLNQMRRMGGCVVMMELPSFCCPFPGNMKYGDKKI